MSNPTNLFRQVAAFNAACGNEPTGPFGDLSKLYRALFEEESVTEYQAALAKLDAIEKPGVDLAADVEAVTELVDALLDTIYIAAGWLHIMGLDPQALWQEVQRSNMDKIDPSTGLVTKREDGKILKPEGWTPPDLKTLVARQMGYITRSGKDLDALLARKSGAIAGVQGDIQQASLVERMFSVERAAVMCGISTTMLRAEIAAGTLKHKVFGANTVRIPESALAEFQK